MNYGNIKKCDSANGLGVRISLFVSGCTNHCKGCFQPETWEFDYGTLYTEETQNSILKELGASYYTGLSILGGEPFEPCNQIEIVKLVREFKSMYPEKNIWMWTGFTYDKDLIPGGCRYTSVTDEILNSIDVLVDGRFVEELKTLTIPFRGSSNQRIIDMKATRNAGELIFHELN